MDHPDGNTSLTSNEVSVRTNSYTFSVITHYLLPGLVNFFQFRRFTCLDRTTVPVIMFKHHDPWAIFGTSWS